MCPSHPPRRALIIVDAQQEYFNGMLPIQYPPREESLSALHKAAQLAKETDTPIVVVRHEAPVGSPLFAPNSPTFELHPTLRDTEETADYTLTKQFSSIFANTDLESWLEAHNIDTITLVGYMTNNCILASAAAAEPLEINVEILTDATGAINLTNTAGHTPAQQVHETVMTLLNSNWAGVATTQEWAEAIGRGEIIARSNLIKSSQ